MELSLATLPDKTFQIVNPGIRRWFSAKNDAVVGYVSSGGVRVVAGVPFCDKSRLAVIAEFEADAANLGKRVCYFGAEKGVEDICGILPNHTKFTHFDGLDSFKAKLRAENWELVFVVSNERQVSFRILYAIASAFSGNKPIQMIGAGLERAAATEIKWLKRCFSGRRLRS